VHRICLLAISFFFIIPHVSADLRTLDSLDVYIYPYDLLPEDILTDGPFERALKIDGSTLLVWVNMHPTAKFAHETLYLLISDQGIRTEKGQWYPVLNGRKILYGERNSVGITSPYLITPQSAIPEARVDVHFYPYVFNSRDLLTDGPAPGRALKIPGNTLLVWVDRQPFFRFAHKTAYVLISQEGIRIEDGEWWPELNGRKILYGDQNKIMLLSPFKIHPSLSPKE